MKGTSIKPDEYMAIRKIADQLIASCDGGMSLSDEIDNMSQEELEALDTMAFECCTCGQWYDIHECATKDAAEFECEGCHGLDE